MEILNPKNINGAKFQQEITSAGIDNTGITLMPKKLVVGVGQSDEVATQAIYDAHDQTPEPVYSITPSINLVAVNDDVSLNITGAPNQTVNIDTGAGQIDITLDENGRGSDVFTPPQAGDYIVKFTNQTLSKIRVKIEAVP